MGVSRLAAADRNLGGDRRCHYRADRREAWMAQDVRGLGRCLVVSALFGERAGEVRAHVEPPRVEVAIRAIGDAGP